MNRASQLLHVAGREYRQGQSTNRMPKSHHLIPNSTGTSNFCRLTRNLLYRKDIVKLLQRHAMFSTYTQFSSRELWKKPLPRRGNSPVAIQRRSVTYYFNIRACPISVESPYPLTQLSLSFYYNQASNFIITHPLTMQVIVFILE